MSKTPEDCSVIFLLKQKPVNFISLSGVPRSSGALGLGEGEGHTLASWNQLHISSQFCIE